MAFLIGFISRIPTVILAVTGFILVVLSAFNITVTAAVEKVTEVFSGIRKEPEYDDEDGRENANTENTDWEQAYDNSGHLTIAEMLQELESYVKDDMTKTAPNSGKGRYLQRVLESCQGWEVKEKTFEY